MEPKEKFKQIQQQAARLQQEEQATLRHLEAVRNDLLRLDGQAALLIEMDPSLAPQRPAPVNPDAVVDLAARQHSRPAPKASAKKEG